MKKVSKFLAGIVGIIVLATIGYSLTLPEKWEASRTLSLQAPTRTVYALISDLKSGWPQWNTLDQGGILITESAPHLGVAFEISIKNAGFKSFGRIAIAPHGNGTLATWTEWGHAGYNPIYRILGSLMETRMGPQIEASLAKLKERAEAIKQP